MINRQVISVCLSFWFIPAFAQDKPFAGHHAAGSGVYSLRFNDVFSPCRNQAALAQLNRFSAGVFAERRFLLESLHLFSFAAVIPTSSGSFGISSSRLGYAAFNRTQAGLAYGRSLGKKLDIGIQADYLAMHIREYGNTSAVTFEGGMIFHFSDQWHAGARVFNPLRQGYNRLPEEKIPALYTLGSGFELSEKFYAGLEAVAETGTKTLLRFFMHYRPHPRFILQGGLATEPGGHFIGMGLLLKNLRMDFTGSYHPQLGVTPGAGIIFQSNKSS